jgi:hypothetical protein|tara:strand:- start:333 stop:1565 length:1233 start_codon:yes stop_codon:yes gene_type:complete
MNRRSFLSNSALFSSLYLGGVSASYAKYDKLVNSNDNAVIFVFLGGGATHIETFNPIPNSPVERRSVTGATSTNVDGIQLGGLFKELSKRTDRVSVVRGFRHLDSSHATATHWVMGGERNQGGTMPNYPSYGSVVAGYYGPTSSPHGLPTYIKTSRIQGDGSAWMGQKFMGYEANGRGVADLTLKQPVEDFKSRTSLLQQIEDRSPMNGGEQWVELQKQASEVITGKASEAFMLEKDADYERFKDNKLGKDMLSAIRAIEYGAKFSTVTIGGWDMHTGIEAGLNRQQPVLDLYLSLAMDRVKEKGSGKNVMFVVTSEFGRTPKINGNAGRDHWSNSVPLLIACDGYEMGRIIGDTDKNAEVAEVGVCGPQDLRWTILSHMGLQRGNTWDSTEGRPMLITGTEEKNILTDI